MRVESVALTLDGMIWLRRHWLEWELALILLLWEWEVFKRRDKDWGRLEACLGPFYIDVYWGIERDLEEDKQDIADVIEATKGYTPGEGISVLETHERMRKE